MSDLPRGWEWSTIGAVTAEVERIDPRTRPEYEFAYIDIGGLDGDRGAIRQTQRLTGAKAPSRARQLVRAGDTVLSTVRTNLRKTAIVPSDLDGQVASTGFSVLRPRRGIDPRFLYYLVRRRQFVDALSALQTGSSYPAVRDRDVRAMPIPVAPHREQERIVAAIEQYLSRLDGGATALRSLTPSIGLLRKAAISETLAGERWPAARWSDIGRTLSGRAFPSGSYSNKGVRLLRPGNLHISGRVMWSSTATTWLPDRFASDYPKYLLRGRHLLMNLTAQSLADDFLGRVCLSSEDDEFLLNQRIAKLTSDVATDEFLYWVFRSQAFRTFVAGLNTGSLIQHISTKQLSEFAVPLPPLENQKRLVATIRARIEMIDRLEDAVGQAERRLAALNRAILDAAFQGDFAAQNPNDEPASVLLDRLIADRASRPVKRSRKVTTS
jgi:type I restriction enzyme S subunit